MRGFLGIFAVVLAGMVPAFGVLAAGVDYPTSGHVVQVIDGDTFVLQTGQHVRLLDINAPELSHDGMPEEPIAVEAKDELSKLIWNKDVTLEPGKRAYDVYGRLLAHVYVGEKTDPNAVWVNGTLVKDGRAHVYTFEDNGIYWRQLEKVEDQARLAKVGIWALPRWQVRDAAACCVGTDMGLFVLVQGVVVTVGHGPQGTRYLNFGTDYRTDFTVKIDGRDAKAFKTWPYWKDLAGLEGHRVLVRGKVAPVNGALIRATHPAQIEVLE